MKRILIFLSAVFVLILSSISINAEEDFNVYKIAMFKDFLKISTETGDQLTKTYDYDALQKIADQLLEKGKVVARAYADYEKECKTILDNYVKDADKMKNMEIGLFEKQYRNFQSLKDKGIDIDADEIEECLDFTLFITAPVTIHILLNQYNDKKNKMLLDRIKKEVKELYDQIDEELNEIH